MPNCKFCITNLHDSFKTITISGHFDHMLALSAQYLRETLPDNNEATRITVMQNKCSICANVFESRSPSATQVGQPHRFIAGNVQHILCSRLCCQCGINLFGASTKEAPQTTGAAQLKYFEVPDSDKLMVNLVDPKTLDASVKDKIYNSKEFVLGRVAGFFWIPQMTATRSRSSPLTAIYLVSECMSRATLWLAPYVYPAWPSTTMTRST